MDLCLTDDAAMRVVEFAQSAAPSGAGLAPNLLLIGAFFAIFYFFVIRPQNKAREDHRSMLAALKRGDQVLTDGGLLGLVEEVDEAKVKVEIAPKVTVYFAKDAIKGVLKDGVVPVSGRGSDA